MIGGHQNRPKPLGCLLRFARISPPIAPEPQLSNPPHSLAASNSPKSCGFLSYCWPRSRTSLRGAYSLERVLQFHAYCRHASLARVLASCVLAPLLPIAVILFVECIPLASPSLGLRANYGVFIRVFVCACATALCLVLQAKNIIPDLSITKRETTTIALATATAYTATFVALSATWVFPVPFIVVVGSLPFTIFTSTAFVVVVGIRRFRAVPSIGQRFSAFVRLAGIQSSMLIIYPSFQAAFLRQRTPLAQIVAVCVLQLIKLALKALLASQIADGIDDFKPEIVVFSVDVYHGLYVSSCMQTANSTWTKIVIVALDVGHQIFSLNGVRKRARELRIHLLETHRSTRSKVDLTALGVALLRNPENLEPSRLRHIQVGSILNHRADTIHHIRVSFAAKASAQDCQAKPTSIFPVPLTLSSPNSVYQDLVLQYATQVPNLDQTQLLEQTLVVLFSCEHLALAEYTECALPFAYAIYLSVMHALPNAQFYPQLASMDSSSLRQAILTILVYSMLELTSFVAFHVVVHRQLGVSPLHQLGFVLENQIEMVEGKLLAWVLIVLHFPLVHMGADFSFNFAWIN